MTHSTLSKLFCLLFGLPFCLNAMSQTAFQRQAMQKARAQWETHLLRAMKPGQPVRVAEKSAAVQDPKTLTNLPADSAIFVQNFIDAEAGDTIGYSTILDTDLLAYFMGNTITKIQTVVPAGAAWGELWVVDANTPTDTLYKAPLPADYPGDEIGEYPCNVKIDSLRMLNVGFTVYFDQQHELHAHIVPCNRNGAFLVYDSKVGKPYALDYTYMRYFMYGDPHLCYGIYLNCVTEGEAGLNPYEIKLDDVTHTRSFIGEEEATFGIGITNYGTEGIPSATLRCRLGDATEDLAFNKPLGYLYYGYIESSLPTPHEAVRVPLTVQLVEVGGEDVSAGESEASGSITKVDPALSVNRMAVMEEFTGGWCGWCPRGARAIELLMEEYSDRFIPIAVHQNDALESEDFMYVLRQYGTNGFPGFAMNRLVSGDPYYGSSEYGGGNMGVKKDIAHIRELPCEATVQIADYALDNDTKELQITTSTSFSIDCATAPYRLTYALTEDSLKVAQSNYYSTEYGGSLDKTPDDLADLVSMPGKYWAVCDHVARSITEPEGVEGTISAPIEKGKAQSFTYRMTLPENIEKPENATVIVLLIDQGTKEILNAASAPLSALSGIDAVKAETATPKVEVVGGQLCVEVADAEVRVYNAAGAQVAARRVNGQAGFCLAPGCYVVRTSNGTTTHTAKVAL